MKRIELMTPEEAVNFIIDADCATCPVKDDCLGNFIDDCAEECREYLLQESEKKKRYEILKTDSDVEHVINAYVAFCSTKESCTNCPYRSGDGRGACLVRYLCDVIPEAPNEN